MRVGVYSQEMHDRKRENGLKLHQAKLRLNIRKNVFTVVLFSTEWAAQGVFFPFGHLSLFFLLFPAAECLKNPRSLWIKSTRFFPLSTNCFHRLRTKGMNRQNKNLLQD